MEGIYTHVCVCVCVCIYIYIYMYVSGEWNDNPIQCSCLGNPTDRVAWSRGVGGMGAGTGSQRVGHHWATKQQQIYVCVCCRKWDEILSNIQKWIVQGVGSCLMLGNELSKETGALAKQEALLGSSNQAGNSRVSKPIKASLHCGSRSQVLWWWGQLSLASHPDLGSFLVMCAYLSQDGFQREGFGEIYMTLSTGVSCSFWPLLNFSAWC